MAGFRFQLIRDVQLLLPFCQSNVESLWFSAFSIQIEDEIVGVLHLHHLINNDRLGANDFWVHGCNVIAMNQHLEFRLLHAREPMEGMHKIHFLLIGCQHWSENKKTCECDQEFARCFHIKIQ